MVQEWRPILQLQNRNPNHQLRVAEYFEEKNQPVENVPPPLFTSSGRGAKVWPIFAARGVGRAIRQKQSLEPGISQDSVTCGAPKLPENRLFFRGHQDQITEENNKKNVFKGPSRLLAHGTPSGETIWNSENKHAESNLGSSYSAFAGNAFTTTDTIPTGFLRISVCPFFAPVPPFLFPPNKCQELNLPLLQVDHRSSSQRFAKADMDCLTRWTCTWPSLDHAHTKCMNIMNLDS